MLTKGSIEVPKDDSTIREIATTMRGVEGETGGQYLRTASG